MKKPISLLIGLCLASFIFFSPKSSAQAQKDILMMVSIDKVVPSHAADYEKAVKNFNAKHRQANVKSVKWWGNQQESFTYVYGVPIENMAALDQAYWKESMQKLSEPAMKNMMKDMNQHLISNELLVYNMVADLSYTHKNMEGSDLSYREWTTYNFKPGHKEEVMKLAKEFQTVYANNNLEASYQIYECIFGKGDNWVVLSRAKDEQHLAKIRAASNKMVSEKGNNLAQRLAELLVSTESVTGRYRPDLSYIPETDKPEETASDKK